MKRIDLTGRTFGRLTAIKYIKTGKYRKSIWLFSCICGNKIERSGSLVSGGHTKSCGCICPQTKHGLSTSLTYASWLAMKARCNQPNHTAHKYYGGRGIQVCNRWNKSFVLFLKDMGHRPSVDHTIDRKNGNLGYFKDNCRWAIRSEQSQNKSMPRAKSPYIGVCFHPKQTINPWNTRICVNYKKLFIGCFKTAKEAAEAYDRAAVRYFGPNAKTNFPKEKQ